MGLDIRHEFITYHIINKSGILSILYYMIGYAIIPIIVPLMAHNIFVLLQLLEYDRQESGMNIYYALKIKAQSVLDSHSHQISPIYFLG